MKQRYNIYNFQLENLPPNILYNLKGVRGLLLTTITNWFKKNAKKKNGAIIAPSEQYFANMFGCSREWVSKSMQWLQDKGFIKIVRRYKKNGQWQTNQYLPGWRFIFNTVKKAGSFVASTVTSAISYVKNHVNCTSHNILNNITEPQNSPIPSEEALRFVTQPDLGTKFSMRAEANDVFQGKNGRAMAEFVGSEEEFCLMFNM